MNGIGTKRLQALLSLGIKTIPDSAKYKYYHKIVALVMTNEDQLAKPVENAYETKSFVQLADSSILALQGISDAKQAQFHKLGVETIVDLEKLKYCLSLGGIFVV